VSERSIKSKGGVIAQVGGLFVAGHAPVLNVDASAVLNLLGALAEAQRGKCFSLVIRRGAATDDNGGARVAPQRLLQDASQLAVTVPVRGEASWVRRWGDPTDGGYGVGSVVYNRYGMAVNSRVCWMLKTI